jgi:hypothetical protein
MAKSDFTKDWLSQKGLVEISPGVYGHPDKDVVKLAGGKEVLVSKEKFVPKQPIINTPDFILNKPVESVLTIEGIVAGLNGRSEINKHTSRLNP